MELFIWIIFAVSMIMFLLGVTLLAIKLCTCKEREIRITMDTYDDEAFGILAKTLKSPEVLGVRYDDSTDVTFMIITIDSSNYSKYMKKLKQIPRIEVI